MGSLIELYPYIKAIHLLSIITWILGLLYLPRIYAYHAETRPGSDTDLTFQTMEHRLLRALITPSMILVFLTGIFLFIVLIGQVGAWFHLKFLLVILLAGLHGILSKYRKNFVAGKNEKDPAYFRTLSFIVAGLVVVIVLLAVLKPF